MLEQGAAVKLAKAFCRAYMGERDVEATLSLVTEDVSFLGTAIHEEAVGREALREYLLQDLAEDAGTYVLNFRTEREMPAGADSAVGELSLEIINETYQLWLQMSVVVRQTPAGCRLCHIHYAVPTAYQQEGEHYPLTFVAENISRIKSELLSESVAGGMMGGYRAPGFPFYYINERMLRYLGYSSEAAFRADNRDSVSNCMHPADRAMVDAEVDRQLSQGDEYTVEYRMRKQDGSYIWVHDVGRTITAEDGRAAILSVCVDITVRKETERRLAESQRRYELAVEGAGIYVWEYDVENCRVFQGEKKVERYGSEPVVEDVPECMIRAGRVREDSVEPLREMYRRLREGASKISGEFWFRYPGMGERCERVCYTLAPAVGGERSTRAYGASMDVTRRKEAEKRYADEVRYREEVETTLLFSCRVDLNRQIVEEQYQGGKLQRDLPYDEAFRTRSNGYLLDGAEAAEIYRIMMPESLIEAYHQGERSLRQTYPVRLSGRQLHWVNTTVNLVRRPESQAVLAFIYTKDATREWMLQTAMDSIIAMEYDFILHVDAQTGHFETVAVRSTLDRWRQDESGVYETTMERALRAAAVTEDLEALIDSLRLAAICGRLERADTFTVDYDMRMRDGEVRRKQLRCTYADRKTNSLVVTRADIEEIVQAEKRKQEALQEALRSAREANSAKSEFMARMSHDMRTPMNGVIGLARLGQEAAPEEARALFRQISESGEYLMLLINDTLEMNRIESGKLELHPEPVRSRQLFERIVNMNRFAAEKKGVTFVARCESQRECWVMVDQERTMQVFNNLLGNAVKFTPSGGQVTFFCGSGGLDRQGRVVFRATVRDNGVGISPAFLPKMFQPFEQENDGTTQENAGSGLGLSIVKRLVELMDGSISVKSRKGEGTTFQIRLPFTVTAAPVEPLPKAVEDVSLEGRRVLLCEDHAVNAQVAIRQLAREGVQTDWAQNGQLGVDRFAVSHPGYYDAVLMDIRMPVLDGLEATRRIRSLPRSDAATVPIIAMTANAFREDREKSRAAGMNDHLSKPVDAQKLYEALRRQLC